MYVVPAPRPPSIFVTLIPIAIFAVLFVLALRIRQISRPTRIGLWLLPWWPASVATLFVWAYFDPSLVSYHYWAPYQRFFQHVRAPYLFSQRFVPAHERFLQYISLLTLLAFVVGLVILCLACLRPSFKWQRVSV
jgi:hypothetical protein